MGIKLNRLKAYRTLNGLTQQQMADLLGITLNSYNNKETGKNEFTSTEVGVMAEKFGIAPGELFSDKDTLVC